MMRVRSAVAASLLSLSALIPVAVEASLDGAGSIMYIPVVAQTASYTSQITVRNPYNATLPVHVFYTGGTGTSGVGFRACTTANVPASSTVQFSVGAQCSLPAGGQFGVLTLIEDATLPEPFQAYSRTQTPGGNGFSVPAYPAGAIEAPANGHYVLGLKRQAAAPTYQTNCFVASTDDPTPYQIQLLDSTGAPIGNSITGSLTAYQMVRYLDIFAIAGLPPGDYSNVTAQFTAGASPTGALLSFCTVQESTFFGADFRMAMPVQTLDGTRQRPTQSFVDSVDSILNMTRHDAFFRHPDLVRCAIDGAAAAVLVIRVTTPDAVAIAGGTNASDTGKFYTGNRSAFGGFSNVWEIDVASKPTYPGPFPVAYTFTCYTGNGGAIEKLTRTLPATF